MAKKLACKLGRHDWTTHVEEGESYKVCAACGKSPREPRQPGPLYRGVVEGAEIGAEADGPVGGVSGIGAGG